MILRTLVGDCWKNVVDTLGTRLGHCGNTFETPREHFEMLLTHVQTRLQHLWDQFGTVGNPFGTLWKAFETPMTYV